MSWVNTKKVYSHQLDFQSWSQSRSLHMHDEYGRCIVHTLVTAEVIITDGRGSFYYLTSDLLNPSMHNGSPDSQFPTVNLVEIAGRRGNCDLVGSFGDQLGPSKNNNFILVQIDQNNHSEDLKGNAITINDLLQSQQKPEACKEYVYAVQAGEANVFSGKRTGPGQTKTHYIKQNFDEQLMVIHFEGGLEHTIEASKRKAGVTKRVVLRSNDAGRWVHIQDVAQPKSNAPLPRPGEKRCKLVGHVACIYDKSLDSPNYEVLVQPLSDTLEGLAKCLGWVGIGVKDTEGYELYIKSEDVKKKSNTD